jgi:hypothetical protein
VVNLAGALKRVAPELDLTLLRDSSATAQRLAFPDLSTLNCAVSPFALLQQWRVRATLRLLPRADRPLMIGNEVTAVLV